MTEDPHLYPGTLYVISAPSGAGKTSLTRALVQNTSSLRISISHTTRAQRANEQHGVHYWFINQDQFQDMCDAHHFLEHAQVFGHSYGTSRLWVEEQLQQGIDVILEIDWQGARQVKLSFPQAVTVFILPPSAALLRERLQHRQQDSLAVIEQRLAASPQEMAHYYEFDYLIVNDVFSEALADLQAIVRCHRLKQPIQAQKWSELLKELVSSQRFLV